MAKRFLGQSLYYVDQKQVGAEIETGGGGVGALQGPGFPRNIKNTLGAFCEGLWSILVRVWVCVGFLAATCASLNPPICSSVPEPQSTVGGRLTALRPSFVVETRLCLKQPLCPTVLCRRPGGGVRWGWGGGSHTNMLINTEIEVFQ